MCTTYNAFITIIIILFGSFQENLFFDSYNKPMNSFTGDGGQYDHGFHCLINNIRSHPPYYQALLFWGWSLP